MAHAILGVMDNLSAVFFVGLLLLPIGWTLTRPAERSLLVRTFWRLWPIVRPIIGWFCLILGVLGVILPILQGIIFLVIGAALIGPRHPVVRWGRVRDKQVIRWLARSRNPLIGWAGRHALRALYAVLRQIRQLRERRNLRTQRQRRFRLALVPDATVCHTLNHWRTRYDPGYQRHLPPHIVVLASQPGTQRTEIEHQLALVCATLAPFEVTLDSVHVCDDDHRIVCSVGEGCAPITKVRATIAGAVAEPVRISQRPIWPAVTIAKLRRPRSLHSAYAEIAAHFVAQTWRVTEFVIFEERWGYMWHVVRRFQLCGSSFRSNDASFLIAEEVV